MALLRDDEVTRLLSPLVRSRTVLEPAETGPSTRSLVCTRFGGQPTGEDGEQWPTCAGCGAELQFVAQVDLGRDALHSAPPIAFFTFFYCWNCHPWGKEKDKGKWLVRTYARLNSPRALTKENPSTADFDECFARSRLERSLPDAVGIEPHCPQLWGLVPGDSGSREAWANWAIVNRVAFSLTGEQARAPHLRNDGVAIGGYPYWANGPDATPRCADCDHLMEVLLQIRPTDLTEASWGDVATLYLFVCRRHPQQTGLRLQGT